MKIKVSVLFALVVSLFTLTAQAESHRATHLGNPATRFAPTLHTTDELRARFADPKLRPDFGEVLRQWGWQGNLDDLFRAAASAEIADIKIPVGDTMPFMSSRENGKAICLRNVTWAGKEPISAYAFNFTSNGRRYRCVTPKPCSNFFVEDLGVEPKPALALDCSAPEQVPAGRPAKVCVTLRNTGDAPEPKSTITLPIPADATITSGTIGGVIAPGQISWDVAGLAPNAERQVCAVFTSRKAGSLEFNSSASGADGRAAQSSCSTRIFTIPGILVEVIDLADPIEVGQQVTYVVTVTNQGDTPVTNVRVICTLPASQEFVSGNGDTEVQPQDKTITLAPLPTLAAKAVSKWQIVTKALAEDDSRFKVELTTDQFEKPIQREESTQLY